MKTTSTRIVALAGAVAISFGAAACGSSDPAPSPAAPSSPSSSTPAASPTSSDSPTPSDSTTPSDTTSSTSSSSSGSQAGQIFLQAKKNAQTATSAALAGFITQNKEKMKIDYRGTRDAKTVDVSIDFGKNGKLHVIAVGGKGYVQGDKAFWTSQGQASTAKKVGNKFLEVPESLSSQMTSSLSLDKLGLAGFSGVTTNDFAKDVGTETVNGTDCWVLRSKDGEGAMYVAKDKNEIVRFTSTKKSPGQLDFSKWNEKPAVKAPPASQILKIGQPAS